MYRALWSLELGNGIVGNLSADSKTIAVAWSLRAGIHQQEENANIKAGMKAGMKADQV